ncbi:Hypothetical predicted protein [Paramuricea clavata]|uniref:Uncharacterized protein n=1 Tax=Paramuricea clavata TaxID=317549 RepID=A0A6S7FZU8_PARCT|nr:Hypothetical predicted protein [Paramuricea clavata]
MVELPENHPEVYAEFMKGNFVVQKSAKKFSLIMITKDQAHKQSNKSLQAHGGAAGLYENPEALALFILAGPDCARIVEEFEAVYDPPPSSTAYHEGHSLQVKFCKDVQSFVDVWAKPFTQHMSWKGWKKDSVPISDTIKRNYMFTFANLPDLKRKGKKDNCTQKQNMTLITQLVLSLQSCPDADMMDFFHFENQREPPSLADQGSLRAGTKSDVLECLNAPTGRASAATQATVVVLDMVAVIHMAKTFNEYVSLNIIPFLEAQMKNSTQRIDAVWDNYPEENNLKALTQQRRGNGPRTRVGDGSTPILKREWNSGFLKNVGNKKELFSFISTQISKIDMGGKLLL